MKNRHVSFVVYFLLSILLWSKPVKPETALDLAHKYLQSRSDSQSLTTHSTQMAGKTPRDRDNLQRVELPPYFDTNAKQTPFHVVTDKNGGFVIISGDDRVIPILASSLDGTIDTDHLPDNFLSWMHMYAAQIDALVASDAEQDASIAQQWDELSSGGFTDSRLETHAINALLQTQWNQSPYYNELCPYDNAAGERAVTGCVATAMAQIMKYWAHPTTGRGSSRYQEATYGIQSADYGGTTYQWSSMPNSLGAASSSTQVTAVATLMYHCGVSVQMEYGVDGSGASPSIVDDAFRNHFGYASTTAMVKRSETTDSIWLASLKNELDAGRPIFYAGFNSEGDSGHAWVCDGYNAENRFHMNWGWGGNSDGYFTLSSLTPDSESDFTYSQKAVIGIAPADSSSQGATLKLYRSIAIDPNPVPVGQAYSIQCDLLNNSASTFTGTIAVGVFSANNQLLTTIGSYTENGLAAGYHYSTGLTFSSSSTGTLQPGSYYISIVYKPNGSDNWLQASSEDYPNWMAFSIEGGTSDLSLYAPLTIGNQGVIQQNSTFNITFNFYNSGETTFKGAVEVDFYDMDGSYRYDVGTLYHYDIVDLAPDHYYTQDRTTTVYGGVNIPPGEYLAAVTHQASSGGSWELTGNGAYLNPVIVTVQSGSDQYEPNDATATLLTAQFVNNQATVTTQYASLHTEDDIDLYRINLPPGLDYQFEARAHDSWSSGNGNTYTTDVFWLLTTPDNSMNFYDDIMDAPVRINNGGAIIIGVAAWGGSIGTYDLEINLTRMARGSLDPNDPHNYITPLYRFYRAGNDSHFFTANEAEKNNIIATQPANFWVYEGISQRVLHSQVPNAVPVYRMFNRISKSHFYTALPSELAAIQQNLGHIFSLEGIAFYALDSEVYGAKPVYRFFSTATASHFFTISKAERDQIIATIPESKLRYEGVAWYAYP